MDCRDPSVGVGTEVVNASHWVNQNHSHDFTRHLAKDSVLVTISLDIEDSGSIVGLGFLNPKLLPFPR